MKAFFVFLWTLFLPLFGFAANIGEWNLYLSYHNAVDCLPVGKEIYVNYAGNLLSYQTEDEEVRLFSKNNGLNGSNIIKMGYSETEKCLILIYNDLLIDLFYPEDGSVVALPQLKNSTMDGIKLNHIFVRDDEMVLALSNGIAHINLKRQEITGFYNLGQNIRCAAIQNGTFYVGTSDKRLLSCSVTGNPLDISEWKTVKTGGFRSLTPCGDQLYAVIDANGEGGGLTIGFWLMKPDGVGFKIVSASAFSHLFSQKGKMVAASTRQIWLFDAAHPADPEQVLYVDNDWKQLVRTSDGLFWACEGYKGLQAYQLKGEDLKAKGTPVGQYGPRRDYCYYMKYHGDELLIAGGRLDPYDRDHFEGTIMTYKNGNWDYFQEDGISHETGLPYRDITCVVPDAKHEGRYYASAGGTGLYQFENKKFVRHFTYDNSGLESAVPNNKRYVRVDGLNFDAEGNLWMVNNGIDSVLKVMRPNGQWTSFMIEGTKLAPTCEKTLIDSKGRLWMASRRTTSNPVHDGGLLCLDYKGTVTNKKDDVATYRYSFTNQDGKSYAVGGVYCMVEDKDGSIWVGTQQGLFVITRPDDWSKSGFYVVQVKVPRNDGTNFADYLLDGVPISAIAIDGGGRKWIGTENDGIYLVSDDGLKVLEHFVAEETPLLSNSIYSIAPNLTTGEIMIGTNKGICSYQSAATRPETGLNDSRVKVFPNPVRPEYHGVVRVTGLTENADIKVTTADGEVVGGGTSTGGTFVWNVRGIDGGRVASGVYYFMISTSDGKDGVVAKIVVI